MLHACTEWLPRRSELGDVWDIVAAGLAFPLAASGLWALGVEATLAPSDLLARLPYAAVLIALIVKLADDDRERVSSFAEGLMRLFWNSTTIPLLVFWVLFFAERVQELAPLLLLSCWLVLVSSTCLPRVLAKLLPTLRKTA